MGSLTLRLGRTTQLDKEAYVKYLGWNAVRKVSRPEETWIF